METNNSVNTNLSGTIYVKMLGGFSISIDDTAKFHDTDRSNQACILIQYLLANRNKNTSIEKIIELIWDDQENCKDPLNAIKNLVYRARLMLKDAFGDLGSNMIIYTSNTYCWNNALPCAIDIEQFDELINKASLASNSNDEKINYYVSALNLYAGDFLPSLPYADWVINTSSYYTNRMHDCTLKLCSLLVDTKNYDQVITICENMLPYLLYEEKIHWYLCTGYILTNQNHKALKHYNYVTNLFYSKLGVTVSESLHDLCAQLLKSEENHITANLSNITSELREFSEVKCAFSCNYEVFKYVYRYYSHSTAYSNQNIYLALITLTPKNIDSTSLSTVAEALNQMKTDILTNLRRNDAVVSYSPSQFILMLPLPTHDIADMVVTRIVNQFKKNYKKNNISVVVKIDVL